MSPLRERTPIENTVKWKNDTAFNVDNTKYTFTHIECDAFNIHAQQKRMNETEIEKETVCICVCKRCRNTFFIVYSMPFDNTWRVWSVYYIDWNCETTSNFCSWFLVWILFVFFCFTNCLASNKFSIINLFKLCMNWWDSNLISGNKIHRFYRCSNGIE